MKSLRTVAALRNLRSQALWRLLAADKSPLILAILQTLLLDNEKTLSSSVLKERLIREIEQLRASGEELPRTAQEYIADWLAQGWITRRFPVGANEEEYELTTDAANAIRFITTVLRPRLAATESRLAVVMQQLTRLAEETDSNPKTRLAALMAERQRIDREIQSVQRGGVKALPDDRALERIREIIALADELTGDFRRVRDEFDKLNRHLRESLMENEGNRGDVLAALFAGVDLIGESDAGKTFAAFWRLLIDPEQSAALETSLSEIVGRPFARSLEGRERRFLLRLTGLLLVEGSSVHDVLQNFARSLKTFVQSREYLEQRRLHSLLKEAQRAALEAKEHVRPNHTLEYSLMLTSSQVRSASQLVMYDPSQRITNPDMQEGTSSEIGLDIAPVRVTVAGRIVAESTRALRLEEKGYPPVYYLPRDDADMSLLVRTKHYTYCPYKGDCTYYSIPIGGSKSEYAVWTYEKPYEAFASIKEYLAFYPSRVDAIEVIS